jgi:hypothetical protein
VLTAAEYEMACSYGVVQCRRKAASYAWSILVDKSW